MMLTIYFETSAQLPPPYSYRYVLKLKPSFQFFHADLQLIYTHRDELDADEIEAEGFSENDDYQWRGNLEKIWRDTVEKLLSRTQIEATKEWEEDSDMLLLEWTPNDKTQKGIPQNREAWLYLAQELVQAIYETSGLERPFELSVLDIQPKTTQQSTLTASFKTRTAQIKQVINGKSAVKFYPWESLSPLMEALYAPDWFAEKAKPEKPKREGLYLNPGDGLWYEWGKQIVEVGERTEALPRLKDLIARLLG
jgi:hypothetical protein